MNRSLIATLTATVLAGALIALPHPATADEWYNEYTVTGVPEFLTGSVQATVTVDGPDAICSMSYAGQKLAAAPWTFTVDPANSSYGHVDSSIDIVLCDGEEDWIGFDTTVPFSLGSSYVSSDSGGARTDGRGRVISSHANVYITNSTDSAANAVITDAKGRKVAAGAVTDSGPLRLPTTKLVRTSRYTVTVANTSGLTMSMPLVVTKGWAALYPDNGVLGTFAPCATITWGYSTRGQPAASNTMSRDVAAGLRRLAKVTGLNFVRVPYTDAQLRYSWKNMGKGGPSGIGGPDGSSSEGGGHVTFNSADWWPHNANRGFALIGGWLPGRGWMAIHETMHALGLDHVNDRTQVMNPVGYSHGFGTGDLEGLRALYPKSGCASG